MTVGPERSPGPAGPPSYPHAGPDFAPPAPLPPPLPPHPAVPPLPPPADPSYATVAPGPDDLPPTSPGRVVERAHPVTPLIRGWLFVVAAAGFFLRDFLPQNNGRLPQGGLDPVFIAAGVAAIAIVAGLSGLVTWLTTKFIADETELTVERGWLFRQSNRISYDRIQSVDVVQPLAARIFGLAEVRIDAGGEGATKLQYLSRQRAGELRTYLMRRAHGQRVGVAESNASAATGALDDLSAADQVLIRVPAKDLIMGAVLSHELLFIVLGFFVPGALIVVTTWLLNRLTGADLPLTGVAFSSVALLLPMATAVFSFLSKRVIGQFNYTLAETSAGLRITRGLTSLTSQSVPAARIQSIRIAQPILWRLVGRYRLDIEVLGYGHQTTDEDDVGTSTILLPIGTQAMVDTALEAVWPGLQLGAIRFHPTPARARVLDPLTYGWLAYGLDDRVVVSRTGWLTRLQSIVPHARLQSVRVTQGPWERRLDLANVEFHTTGLLRSHGIHHLDAAEARAMVFDEADRAKQARTAEALLVAQGPARPEAPAAP